LWLVSLVGEQRNMYNLFVCVVITSVGNAGLSAVKL
jgi:hypothetical protein